MARREQLNKYLLSHIDKEFIWGKSDCLRIAMDWAAMIGKDYFQPYRDCYTTRIEAAKALRNAGYGTIEKYLDDCFKVTDNPQEGDLALFWNKKTVGIVGAFNVYFFDKKAMIVANYEDCSKFYRVDNG